MSRRLNEQTTQWADDSMSIQLRRADNSMSRQLNEQMTQWTDGFEEHTAPRSRWLQGADGFDKQAAPVQILIDDSSVDQNLGRNSLNLRSVYVDNFYKKTKHKDMYRVHEMPNATDDRAQLVRKERRAVKPTVQPRGYSTREAHFSIMTWISTVSNLRHEEFRGSCYNKLRSSLAASMTIESGWSHQQLCMQESDLLWPAALSGCPKSTLGDRRLEISCKEE